MRDSLGTPCRIKMDKEEIHVVVYEIGRGSGRKKITPHSRAVAVAVGDLYITHNYQGGLDLGISNRIWSSGGYSSTCGAFSYFILGGN